MLAVSNPTPQAATFTSLVETRQIAPTIVRALGLDPTKLQAVQQARNRGAARAPVLTVFGG